MKPRTWYVIADGGRAKIFLKRDTQDFFDMQRELVSANIHSHTHELGTERPGRGRESADSGHHAVEPREDLHQADKRNFAREVSQALNQANSGGEFDQLILVAPAHVLADIDHALDASTKGKVGARLQKDLTNVPNADLAKHFAGELRS